MQKKLLLLFFFLYVFSHAQDLTKDTIQLREVNVNRIASKNYSFEKVKSKYSDTRSEGLINRSELITLINDLPDGLLYNVRLYFNDKPNPNYESEVKNLADTLLDVVFYSVNSDNSPGDEIADKEIVVPKIYKGKMDVNIAELNIVNRKKIYLGIRKKDSANFNCWFETFIYVDSTTAETKKEHNALSRKSNKSAWSNAPGTLTIRYEITVANEKG